MATKADKQADIDAIYSDIRVTLLGKLMERVNVVYHEGDLKEMKRLQGRLVKIIQSYETKEVSDG